jgi:N-acetylneuraminate lyase
VIGLKISLKGLVAAPHSPFNEDGSLHLSVIEKQVAALSENRVSAAFICGTTGEGMSMTLPERKQAAERWVDASRGNGLKVVVNASHLCLSDIRELGAHAAGIGADAFAIMAPSFFRPARLEDLIEFCARAAGGAPGLPFYYYHIPSMTGVALPMAEFLPRAAEHIPNFAGIKFTSEDLMDYNRSRIAGGDSFEVLFGRDEILLSALALGATGAIGSTYNFCAPLYHRVIAAFQAGDMETAQEWQAKAMEMVAVLNRYGGLAAGKAMMALNGIDCGPVRLPLRRLGPAEMRGLREDMERLGVLSRGAGVPA